MISTTNRAMIAKIQVCPVAKEKAAPGFRTRTSPNARPIRAVCRPSDRAESAHCLLIWSTTTMTTAITHSTVTGIRRARCPIPSSTLCGPRVFSMTANGVSAGGEMVLSVAS